MCRGDPGSAETCWLCHCCSWQTSFFVSKFLQQNVKNFKNCDLGKFLKQTLGNYQLKKMCWNMTISFMKFMSTHGGSILTEASGCFFEGVDLTVWPRYEKNTGHSNEVLQALHSNSPGGGIGRQPVGKGRKKRWLYEGLLRRWVKNPIFCLNVSFWVD